MFKKTSGLIDSSQATPTLTIENAVLIFHFNLQIGLTSIPTEWCIWKQMKFRLLKCYNMCTIVSARIKFAFFYITSFRFTLTSGKKMNHVFSESSSYSSQNRLKLGMWKRQPKSQHENWHFRIHEYLQLWDNIFSWTCLRKVVNITILCSWEQNFLKMSMMSDNRQVLIKYKTLE